MSAGDAPRIREGTPDVAAMERELRALRDSERRLRAAVDAGRDAFVITHVVRDDDGAIVDFLIDDANARASALVNVPVAALIGQSLLVAFPLSRESGLWEQCCRVLVSQRPFEMSQPAPIPEAPGRWLQRQIVPTGDGVAITSRDVTARRQEQQALEASEARHRQLFESSGAIQLIVAETTGVLIDVNPAAESFYGWPRATMRAMYITDLDASGDDFWVAFGERANGVAATRPVMRVHRVASGQRRDVEFASSPVVIDGRLARHLIVHDVSDRERAQRELRESEARFRAVIDEMSEGVVVHDANGAIRMFNPSAERILGLSGSELQGLEPIARDWRAVHDDGTPWPVSDHPASVALRTGVSQPRAVMGIMRGETEYAWLHVTADPLLRAGEDKPYAAVAVFSDITAQRVANERLREAQTLEAVGQLAGGIAHDFNNLLTVIRGASGFLRDSLGAESTSIDDVRAIERATDRAEELTRRLLAIGRRQLLRAETVNLSVLAREQGVALRRDLPSTIDVQVSVEDEAVYARLDREQLINAIQAMVDNARAAMRDVGTLRITSRLESRPHGERGDVTALAVLELADSGEGMSEEVRARLFEPFFSTQPFGSNRGIHLASVHGMVVQSRGAIECDSAPGEGTTFRLYFPLVAAAERQATPPSGAPSIAVPGVLVVDDDTMLRDRGRRMLERRGHTVTMCGSGDEALAFLSTNATQVALMLTDLTMPGMSGHELIARVEERYPALPIVAMSGFTMNASVRDELESRRIPFVGKPFTADDLTSAIARALNGAAARQTEARR